MRQTRSDYKVIVAAASEANGAPEDEGDGVELDGAMSVSKHLIKVDVVATDSGDETDFMLHLWGHDGPPEESGEWGTCGDADGALNGGEAIAGTGSFTRFFVVENLGVFGRAYTEIRSLTAEADIEISISIAEVVEQGD